MKVRCGIDIVDISRFVKILEKSDDSFLEKCFSDEEMEYCSRAKDITKKAERFAARFAAKEAAGKALGTGLLNEGVGMHDIEVIKDVRGTPELRLAGGALTHAEDLGVSSISLSLSHDGGMACAYCVMLSEK